MNPTNEQFEFLLDTLEQVGATNSRNEKERLLSKVIESSPDMKEVIRQICFIMWDGYITYGVTVKTATVMKYVAERDAAGPVPELSFGTHWFPLYSDILKKLSAREWTGHDAIRRVHQFIADLPPKWRPWFIKFTNRNWGIGVSYTTMRKLWGESFIPMHSCELCEDDGSKELDGSRIMEPKFNGLRVQVGKIHPHRPEEFLPLSRGGLPYENLKVQTAALAAHSEELVYDCEAYIPGLPSDESYARTVSVLTTHGDHPDAKLVRLYIFDVLTQVEWEAKVCVLPLHERKQALFKMVGGDVQVKDWGVIDLGFQISIVPGFEVNLRSEIEPHYRAMLEANLEGYVIKEKESLYSWSRSGRWRRRKDKFTEELVIKRLPTGWLNTRTGEIVGEIPLIGALAAPRDHWVPVVRTLGLGYVDEDKVEVWVGTGFDDAQQCIWYDIRDSMFDKVVMFEHYGVLSQGGRRHPVFLEIRTDKFAKDILRP
jgi:hypothetical protein